MKFVDPGVLVMNRKFPYFLLRAWLHTYLIPACPDWRTEKKRLWRSLGELALELVLGSSKKIICGRQRLTARPVSASLVLVAL